MRTPYNVLKEKFDQVSKRIEKYETYCEELEKDNNDLKMHYKSLFDSIKQKKDVSQVFTKSIPKVNVSDKIYTSESSKPISKKGNIHTDLMLYYKIPKLPLHNGLKSLACDKDVMEMCQYVSQCKLMEVFVIHPISEPDLVDNEFDPLFSYPDNNTCKNKPSESNPAKGPSESNPAKRPCESNAGKSFSESNDGKRGSGSSNVKRPSGSNKGKRPIVIEDDDGSDSSEYSGDSEDSDDSDFDIGDEDIIGDVDVDMDDFRKHTDENVEWTECTEKEVQVPPPFDYEEVDLEEFGSGTESDDPECERKRALKKLAKAHRPVDGLVYSDNFYIGQCLANKTLIKEMVSKIAVAQRRQLWLSRNDKTRMTAECRGKVPVFNDGGPVCKESGPLENKPKGDSVKCNKKSKKKGQVGESIKCPCSIGMCTASFLSKEIEEAIKPDPRVPIASLKDQLQRKYELGLSDMKIFRAKQMAEERLFGDWAKQYAQLRQFAIGIERKNSRNKLSRLMWKDNGFKAGKRDLLGLDGCFLSGPYPGQILTAVGVDPNNGIYPLAYAVVEGETKESWLWFLDCLGDDLELFRNSNFTFISDRQKGRTIQGPLVEMVLSAKQFRRFGKNMEEIKKLNPEMYNWLKDIPPQHWARSHFSGRPHCDVLLNNMCEVLNRQLLKGRDKPIVTCLEFIREYLMKRIVVVQGIIDKSTGPLTPNATKLFNLIKRDAAQYKVIWNGGDLYDTTGPYGDKCVVNIRLRSCACRKWEITGMPCKHAVASIWNMANNGLEPGIPESWVHESYWLKTWVDMYRQTKKEERKSAAEFYDNLVKGAKLSFSTCPPQASQASSQASQAPPSSSQDSQAPPSSSQASQVFTRFTRLLQKQRRMVQIAKETESLKVEIKSLQTENKVLKSKETKLINLEKVYGVKASELLEKIKQMKSQVSELLEKLKISDQEMKQQILILEKTNEFATKFMFLKYDTSLKKMFEMIEKEYESNVSKISITSSTFETKNLELVKELGEQMKCFDEEKKVFENTISKLEKDLAQRVKDFDDVKIELLRRTDKFETYFSNLEKQNALLKS
ncbi:mutator type transposase [Tanacetum coccineum]